MLGNNFCYKNEKKKKKTSDNNNKELLVIKHKLKLNK